MKIGGDINEKLQACSVQMIYAGDFLECGALGILIAASTALAGLLKDRTWQIALRLGTVNGRGLKTWKLWAVEPGTELANLSEEDQ